MSKATDLEEKRARAIDGVPSTKFSKPMRSTENMAFEVGDVITLPTPPFNVFKRAIGSNVAEYVIVEVKSAAGVESAKQFYPTVFTKRRPIYNEDKTPTGRSEVTKGTAAVKAREFVTTNEAMEALAGKKVKVSDIDIIRTLNFDRTDVVDDKIMTLDLVD